MSRAYQRASSVSSTHWLAVAGLPDAGDFSGHSLRSGLATEVARSGATDNAIMNQTGHTDVRSVKRYIRCGRRFTHNVLNKIDL